MESRFKFEFGLSYSGFTVSNTAVICLQSNISLDLSDPPSWKAVDSISISASNTPDPDSLLFPDGFDQIENQIYPSWIIWMVFLQSSIQHLLLRPVTLPMPLVLDVVLVVTPHCGTLYTFTRSMPQPLTMDFTMVPMHSSSTCKF